MLEHRVADHYTHGALGRTILEGLRASGKDVERLDPVDLAPVDEFHIGHRQATIHLAEELGVRRGMRLLDIGCGLGGASRYFSGSHGCRVEGIDVTPEYVEVARELARRTGQEGSVSYRVASALSLPFDAASFDGAYMLHVGMNVEDKGRLFAEVRRVLAPGSAFGVYDVMRIGEGELALPVPWAASAETNFIAEPATYRRLAEAAGFTVERQNDRGEFAIEFFRQVRARMAASGGPPPIGLHLLLGSSAEAKVRNMMANLERGTIAPVELICRVP
jgi:ubiquinone/menaquinone biosynthesis C-methylase UbiE